MARSFATGGNYLVAGSAPATAMPLTMSAWAYPTASSGWGCILLLGISGSHNSRWALLRGQDNLELRALAASSGGAFSYAVGADLLTLNAWNHCLGTFDSTTLRTARVNGGTAGTQTTSRVPATGQNGVFIGANSVTAGDQYEGRISEAGIWDVILTEAEQQALARGYSPLRVRPQNLIFYAPMIRENVVYRGPGLSVVGSVGVEAHNRMFMAA